MNLNFEYQQAAFDKLSKLRAGALFMKMGTGKTKVALDLVKAQQENFDVVIWIAPASLIREKNYQNEIKKWSGGLLRPIEFYSIEGVSASDTKYLEMRTLATNKRSFCVVDESITIKNTDAGRTKRLLNMWNLFNFRLILNGTPLTQGLIDLYSQIQFLHPKILNMTEAQFANHFLTYKKDGSKPWKRWSKPENEEALIEIIRPYIFDCELDIPVKMNEYAQKFCLSEQEAEKYAAAKRVFLDGRYEVGFLEVAQKFQHIYSSCQEKLDYLKELVPTLGKVIIYVKFVDEVEHIRKLFNCVVLTGSEKGDLSRFEKDIDVLICTYGVGSMGMNWQFANNIIYFTQTFDYKDKIQSMHRIYRIGQKKDCNIYNFWVNTGLDDLIKKSLDKKQNTLNNVEKIISKEKAMQL
jgi:SNF2 family DNA or RNA helicase